MHVSAATVVLVAITGWSAAVATPPATPQPQARVMTPAQVVEEAESLLERQPITVRFRVANVDTMPVITESGESTTEMGLHPGCSFAPELRASFHVSVSADALRALRDLGVDPFDHFVGKTVAVTGRLHMAVLALVGSPQYDFYHLSVTKLDQLRVVAAGDPTPLAEAVDGFNADASVHAVGGTQPPLTEAEVIGVLNWTALEEGSTSHALSRISAPSPSPSTFDLLRAIVATRTLPAGVALESMARYETEDHVYEVWSIRLRITRPDGSSFVVSIRERMIGSRPIGPAERAVIARWRERWAHGVGSMERSKLMEQERRERAEAMELDRGGR